MGVDYRAVLGIGIRLGDVNDVIDFLLLNNLLSEEEREYVEENSITEYSHESGIEVIGLDVYRGDDFFVGYELNIRDPDVFADRVNAAISDWKRYFPDVEPLMIHTVKVY